MAKVAMPVGFQLTVIDDGTLDTVIRCLGCKTEQRYQSHAVRLNSGMVNWGLVYGMWYCDCIEEAEA